MALSSTFVSLISVNSVILLIYIVWGGMGWIFAAAGLANNNGEPIEGSEAKRKYDRTQRLILMAFCAPAWIFLACIIVPATVDEEKTIAQIFAWFPTALAAFLCFLSKLRVTSYICTYVCFCMNKSEMTIVSMAACFQGCREGMHKERERQKEKEKHSDGSH